MTPKYFRKKAQGFIAQSVIRALDMGHNAKKEKAQIDFDTDWLENKLANNPNCEICGCVLLAQKLDKYFPSNLMVIDHKIPLGAGGTTTKENLQIVCHLCNKKKRPVENKINIPIDQFINIFQIELVLKGLDILKLTSKETPNWERVYRYYKVTHNDSRIVALINDLPLQLKLGLVTQVKIKQREVSTFKNNMFRLKKLGSLDEYNAYLINRAKNEADKAYDAWPALQQ